MWGENTALFFFFCSITLSDTVFVCVHALARDWSASHEVQEKGKVLIFAKAGQVIHQLFFAAFIRLESIQSMAYYVIEMSFLVNGELFIDEWPFHRGRYIKLKTYGEILRTLNLANT